MDCNDFSLSVVVSRISPAAVKLDSPSRGSNCEAACCSRARFTFPEKVRGSCRMGKYTVGTIYVGQNSRRSLSTNRISYQNFGEDAMWMPYQRFRPLIMKRLVNANHQVAFRACLSSLSVSVLNAIRSSDPSKHMPRVRSRSRYVFKSLPCKSSGWPPRTA